MNEVISNYIEESHRNLLNKKGPWTPPIQGAPKRPAKKLPQIGSQPGKSSSPRRPDGSSAVDTSSIEVAKSQLASQLRSRAICSITEESHEDALREIDRLMKKNKSLEDELSISMAKKMSFKSQALRDQKELKKMTETLATIQKDISMQREETEYKSELSKEIQAEQSEMRLNHIREIKLLQRGLKARTDEGRRNRVDEIADLVDSLGRAALQRDNTEIQNQKLRKKVRQANIEIKTLQDERRKYLQSNYRMNTKIQEIKRANKLLMDVGNMDRQNIEADLSEEEFEDELGAFEKRYAILDEGARGLDHWVEKLHREQGRAEKRTSDSTQDIAGLEKSIKQWQELNDQKDAKIEVMAGHLKEMRQKFGVIQLEVTTKSQEMQVQLDEERRRYENKLKQLQTEVEYARSTAQGYQSLSKKLQDELVRTAAGEPGSALQDQEDDMGQNEYDYDSYDAMENQEFFQYPEKEPSSEELSSPLGQGDEDKEASDKEVAQQLLYDVYSREFGTNESDNDQPVVQLAQQAAFAKTGELLQLEVRQEGNSTVLYGHELSTNERYTVHLDSELVQELDPEDPWAELFTVVGITLGPPKDLVLPTLVGRREVPLAPCGVWMILTVYKYDNRRFFLNGFDPQSQRLVDLVVMEDSFTAEACQIIDSITDDEVLFDFFLGRLLLYENPPDDVDEEEPPKLRLVFNATT